MYQMVWRDVIVIEPVGQMRDGDGNTFQQDVVDMIVKTRGAYIDGMGGTGKSTLVKGNADIKGLVSALEDAGYTSTNDRGVTRSLVHCLAFTHVGPKTSRISDTRSTTSCIDTRRANASRSSSTRRLSFPRTAGLS